MTDFKRGIRACLFSGGKECINQVGSFTCLCPLGSFANTSETNPDGFCQPFPVHLTQVRTPIWALVTETGERWLE